MLGTLVYFLTGYLMFRFSARRYPPKQNYHDIWMIGEGPWGRDVPLIAVLGGCLTLWPVIVVAEGLLSLSRTALPPKEPPPQPELQAAHQEIKNYLVEDLYDGGDAGP